MMPEESQPKPPWELSVKLVVITAAALWLFGAVGLLIYLFGNRGP